jgi:hypothetical protein
MNAAPQSDQRSPRYTEQEVREFAAQVPLVRKQDETGRSGTFTVKALRSPGKRKPKLLRA